MKDLLTLPQRIAWATWICIGPIAGMTDLLVSRSYSSGRTRGGSVASYLYIESAHSLTESDFTDAVVTGLTWAVLSIPIILLLYYAAKYVLTGRISNSNSETAGSSIPRPVCFLLGVLLVAIVLVIASSFFPSPPRQRVKSLEQLIAEQRASQPAEDPNHPSPIGFRSPRSSPEFRRPSSAG